MKNKELFTLNPDDNNLINDGVVEINTAKDEMTPFFDNDTRTLYFSSAGWGGLGGLDIYKTIGDNKIMNPYYNHIKNYRSSKIRP